jgi:hypothetical protein
MFITNGGVNLKTISISKGALLETMVFKAVQLDYLAHFDKKFDQFDYRL